jgi:hypothetical protein
MSEATTTSAQARIQNPLILTVIPLLILFAAAAVLFRMTTDNLAETYKYWEIFVPAVAVLSLFSGWHQCQMMGNDRIWYVLRQFIHWGAVLTVIYLFHVAGFRDLLDERQYTVILIGVLAVATLLDAIQMDYKLVFFSLFLAFLAFVLHQPEGNPGLVLLGSLFGIDDPASHPATVVGVLAGIGFILSLGVHWLIPRRRSDKPREKAAASSTGPSASSSPGNTGGQTAQRDTRANTGASHPGSASPAGAV